MHLVVTSALGMQVVRARLSNGGDVHAKDSDGFTALHHADPNDHEQVACLMLVVTGRVDLTTVEKLTLAPEQLPRLDAVCPRCFD